MRTVGSFEAKTHLSQLLREVEQTGCEIVIQRHGRNVAVLSPWAEGRNQRDDNSWILDTLEAVRRAQPVPTTPAEIREFIDEGRRR